MDVPPYLLDVGTRTERYLILPPAARKGVEDARPTDFDEKMGKLRSLCHGRANRNKGAYHAPSDLSLPWSRSPVLRLRAASLLWVLAWGSMGSLLVVGSSP